MGTMTQLAGAYRILWAARAAEYRRRALLAGSNPRRWRLWRLWRLWGRAMCVVRIYARIEREFADIRA